MRHAHAAPALVILAAGAASRFGSPKQLAAVGPGGEALLDYAIFDAARERFAEVVFVVSPELAPPLRERALRHGGTGLGFRYVVQDPGRLPAGSGPVLRRRKPWGTGHALYCALSVLDRPAVVINGDDFYGRDALRSAADWLRANAPDPQSPCTFAMVGYRLEATLSDGGGVSRAICRVGPDACVTGIQELLEVARTDRGIHGCNATGGERRELTGQETVSMNLWACPPGALAVLERELRRFIASRGAQADAEFMIGPALGAAIARGDARLRVLPTAGDSFGLTFAHDLPGVRAAIARLVERGVYPTDLIHTSPAPPGPG